MPYFNPTAHALITDKRQSDLKDSSELRDLHTRFLGLHQRLYLQLAGSGIQLNVIGNQENPITFYSVAQPQDGGVLAVRYLRSLGLALTVEKMLGRDELTSSIHVQQRHHPVIELRLSPDYLTLEFLMSPLARVDQANLVKKLAVSRHRDQFHQLLSQMPANFKMGFWGGLTTTDAYLNPQHLRHRQLFDDWFGTFAPAQDYLRVGAWYSMGSPEITHNRIESELMSVLKALFPLYQFISWRGDNNFVS